MLLNAIECHNKYLLMNCNLPFKARIILFRVDLNTVLIPIVLINVIINIDCYEKYYEKCANLLPLKWMAIECIDKGI